MKNYVIDASRMPAIIRNGLYKILIYISNSKKVVRNGLVAEVNFY